LRVGGRRMTMARSHRNAPDKRSRRLGYLHFALVDCREVQQNKAKRALDGADQSLGSSYALAIARASPRSMRVANVSALIQSS
jgi:hypothetical protein